MGEGQTKRQIVGSLDMSSLHQTKELTETCAFYIPRIICGRFSHRAPQPDPHIRAVDYYCQLSRF